jgi:hypothetical protein
MTRPGENEILAVAQYRGFSTKFVDSRHSLERPNRAKKRFIHWRRVQFEPKGADQPSALAGSRVVVFLDNPPENRRHSITLDLSVAKLNWGFPIDGFLTRHLLDSRCRSIADVAWPATVSR